MLSINEQVACKRTIGPRHHYILLLRSSDPEMTKQVEMFADDLDEAVALGCRSKIYHAVEIWEDGRMKGERPLQ